MGLLSFYQKSMANMKLIPADSAMTSQVKFSALVEELGRRLRNTCPSLLQEQKINLVRDFNIRLAKGEHKEEFRYRVTQTALKLEISGLESAEIPGKIKQESTLKDGI